MKTLEHKSSRRGNVDHEKEAEDDRRAAAIARLTAHVTEADVHRVLQRAAALRKKALADEINGD